MRRGQLGPSRRPVRGRPASEMRGEVLDVCLPSRAVRGRLVKWKAALLQYQMGLVAIRNDLDLDDGLIVLSGGH